MKNIFILLLISGMLTQCSKKNVEVIQEKSPEMMDHVDQSWRSAIPTPGPARSIQIGDYQSFDLDNGLKVIVVENNKIPRVSYSLRLLNNPIIEGDQAGYVSMAGQLMRTGTDSKSKAEIDAAIDFIGANLTTSSGGVFASGLKKHQGKLLDLMTDVLYNASFPQEEFDKVKNQALSGLATTKTDPSAIAGNIASVVRYGKDHPYGEVQTEKSTQNITLDNCKKYYNDYFRPNNAYLVVVGDITMEEAKKNAMDYFGKWEKGVVDNPSYAVPEAPSERKVIFGNKDGAVQSVINITYPVNLKPGSADVLPVRVMNSVLGGGVFLGRLMKNLREDKAYTYGARSSIGSDDLVASFTASASVRNEVTDSSVTEFIYEMERMVNEPISQEDLQLVKNSIAGSFARSLESPQTIANFALNTYRYGLPENYFNSYLERLDAITVEDVQATAKKYIRPDNAYIVVVGSKDDVSEKLIPFDGDKTIDFYGAFGERIEISNDVMPDNLTAEDVINDYIEAIGGRAAWEGVKTMKQVREMSLMGQTATLTMSQKAPNKFALVVGMQGMTVQEQRFDGVKGMSGQMGNNQVITEGPQLEAMKSQADIFPHLNYSSTKTLELKGIEEINGKKAYKIMVTGADGKTSSEFYDIQNSYLIRTVGSQDGPGGQVVTIITDMTDYKEVSGVLLPHSLTIEGMMPQAVNMNLKTAEVNGVIDDAEFKVE